MPRQDLLELVARQRYGIHAKEDEHFGIGVAEMVRAGCITFAHNSGGTTEILGGDDRLLYASTGEAVEKIVRIMESPHETHSVRMFLQQQGELFGTDRFVREARQVVKQFLAQRDID